MRSELTMPARAGAVAQEPITPETVAATKAKAEHLKDLVKAEEELLAQEQALADIRAKRAQTQRETSKHDALAKQFRDFRED
jgi:hypothetical protein